MPGVALCRGMERFVVAATFSTSSQLLSLLLKRILRYHETGNKEKESTVLTWKEKGHGEGKGLPVQSLFLLQ